jgi:hypothetical protein
VRITYKRPEDAASAQQKFDGQFADGRKLSVKFVGSVASHLSARIGNGPAVVDGSVDAFLDDVNGGGSSVVSMSPGWPVTQLRLLSANFVRMPFSLLTTALPLSRPRLVKTPRTTIHPGASPGAVVEAVVAVVVVGVGVEAGAARRLPVVWMSTPRTCSSGIVSSCTLLLDITLLSLSLLLYIVAFLVKTNVGPERSLH